MDKDYIENIFRAFQTNLPKPKTELIYTNNFTLLIAVILSARSTDKAVNNATKDLFIEYDTPQKIYNLGEKNLLSYIATIGLNKSKTKNIMSTCKILLEEHEGEVPSRLEELLKLPGVGRKTANVVLNAAFSLPTMPVDTHVLRVSNRIGLSNSNKPDVVEQDLLSIVPAEYLTDAHNWLVLHGRYVCKAQKPLCKDCIIHQYCRYFNDK